MNSYIVPLYKGQITPIENGIYSEIIRLIAQRLDSVKDVIAFALTCKHVYESIIPLFSIRFHGDDWTTFCMRGTGPDIVPIKITHIRGCRYVYVVGESLYPADANDVFCWERFHLNAIIKALSKPKMTRDGIEYVIISHHASKRVWFGGKSVHAYAAIVTNGNARYFAKDAHKLLTRMTRHRYTKRLRP